MEVTYHKDFNKNYVVFHEEQWQKEEDFCYQMLRYNKIEGVLPVDRRMVDNKVQLFYDITGKQSLLSWMERSLYDYQKIKQLYRDLIAIIEESRKYLLYEDNFMVDMEYIFVDIMTGKPYLCYRFGYQCPIIKQINHLTEYFMDKVNYSDKEVVYFIYQLHGTGKEQGFTLNHIKQLLYQENQKDETNETDNIKNVNNKNVHSAERVQHSIDLGNRSKRFQEASVISNLHKVEDEVEKFYYPIKTYIISALVVIIGLGIFIYCIRSGFFYNPYGKRIDFIKVVAVAVLILSLGSYLLAKVWNKGNRLTKIVVQETDFYNDQDRKENSNTSKNNEFENYEAEYNETKKFEYIRNFNDASDSVNQEEEEDHPTSLLNDVVKEDIFILKSIGSERAEDIIVDHTPFFIGKRKGNVDHWIDQEGVSRYHAKITKEDGDYYITDLNSMNGTYVNESPVGIYEKRKIAKGDLISIATCRYLCEQI